MSAGALRERVRFETQPEAGAGYVSGAAKGWTELCSVAARIKPAGSRSNTEEAIADTLVALSTYEITVRKSPKLKPVTAGDRIVDARNSSRIFNIRYINNPDERNKYLVFTAELGRPDDGA